MSRALRAFAALVATGALALVPLTRPAAADPGEPWRDPGKPAPARADALLAVLTQDEKLAAAVGDLAPLARHGVPLLNSKDGPSGIGLPGTTAFPSSQALAATFDTGDATAVGAAIARELRGKGRNVWLGPAVDIARTPLAGRQPENLGEDPYLAGELAAAESAAAKAEHVIVTAKHYTGNNQEYYRTGVITPAGRTGGINTVVSERALKEIYERPFTPIVTRGGADAVMCSYNQVNGLQACQNKKLLDDLKKQFGGIVTPDFGQAVRDQAAAANAGVDLPQYDQGSGGRTKDIFTSGAVPQARLDDIVRRTLFAIFNSGVYDNPVGPGADVVSTPEHRELATKVATDSTVLLKNRARTLPLDHPRSIAVIGPSGSDALYTNGGSAAVPTTVGGDVTPLAGIRARAGVTVTAAQGSAGDVPAVTPIPGDVLTTTDSSGARVAGVTATYWNNPDFTGNPALTRTDASPGVNGTPAGVTSPYSARWTGTLTPPETGLYRITMLGRGIASLYLGGKRIATGYREGASFLAGPQYPIQGTIRLTAGKPIDLRVDYAANLGRPGLSLAWQTPSQTQIPAAVEAARTADVAVVFANSAAGEGMDHSSLSLQGDQNELIEAVAKVNRRTVVVLNTGGPVLMPWLDKVDAVIQAWYPGQQFGTALAAVLFGDTDPGGRLPVTFPATDGQGPAAAGGARTYPGVIDSTTNAQSYAEGIYVGYRWYDKTGQKPLFPFGHGLSYSTFRYDSDVSGSFSDTTTALDAIAGQAKVNVTNTGPRAGSTTVQVYVGHLRTTVDTPARQLAGVATLRLKPGENRQISIPISTRSLSYFDEKHHAWRTPCGRVPIYIGSSSADTRLAGWITCKTR
ncbi:glycoside hydrolase family 3 protein [Nonomuraea sp. NPDC050153]|uniref:glycoside hydrolase family 3 protein n=1 Tax=Nonomuraea sp. NPDC050153 TaxID=3364359 RepID=UPI0037BB704E